MYMQLFSVFVPPEGEFGERSGAILEAVIHWNYVSVGRGKDSLIGRLIHQDKSKEAALGRLGFGGDRGWRVSILSSSSCNKCYVGF